MFLLQVSGPAAVISNPNLNWALSINLATRLDYVTVDNLYLLNYTQLPSNHRRSLLQASTPTPTPSVGEVSAGVINFTDLTAEAANLTTIGTGVMTSNPSIAYMYEADVGNKDYISYVHNQLNSIIATSALLSDVRSANLSINSIYLVSFEPAYDNTSSTASLSNAGPGKAHKRISIILISTLIPVALVLGAATGVFIFWQTNRRQAARRGFQTQASSLNVGSDSERDAKQAAMGMKAYEGKELMTLASASTSASFTHLSIASSGTAIAAMPRQEPMPMPPAWINDVPFSDWEIDADELAICLRPDGRKWELGAGAFSKVIHCGQWPLITQLQHYLLENPGMYVEYMYAKQVCRKSLHHAVLSKHLVI